MSAGDAPVARVLFVITTLDVGGAEKHLLLLCRGLVLRGFAAEVVYLKGGGRLRPDFEASGVTVGKIAFEKPWQAPRAILQLASRMRRGRFDLVHTHLLKADALGAVARVLARRPPLVSSKHNEEQVLRRRPVALVHGVLSRVPARVIALSEHVRDYVRDVGRVPAAALRRIYYGIDPRRFAAGDRAATRAALGLRDGQHVGLCVARFHPQKDHPTLFRAVARLAARGRDVVLLLAGGDPFHGLQADLERRVAELGLEGHVRFLGIRDDVADLLAACDVFVLPSRFEGLGLVFLEAMAAGRAVLSTDCSAIPEVVEHGATGLLVPVGDDAALAASWEQLIDAPERAAALGARGRAQVEARFGLARMIEETLAVYREAGGPAARF